MEFSCATTMTERGAFRPSLWARDEGAQALLLAVLAAAVAAAAIGGLLQAQERLLWSAHEGRAGEAAAQAAGAVVADAHYALVMAGNGGASAGDPAHLASFLRDPGLAERALTAARELSAVNDGPAVTRVEIADAGRGIDITVDAGRRYRVTIEKVECCRR